jgi:signal transduction histidine kinase
MSERKLTLLVIDDDPGDAVLLRRQLEDIPGWEAEVTVYQDPAEARSHLRNRAVDFVIVDYLLGPVRGLEVLKDIRGEGDERPVILLTGHGDERIAAEITRAGADDYLVKAEMTPDQLRRSIENALAQFRLRQEKALLSEELRQSQKMEAIGQLAGGLAHDFNNMLTGILGFVELALMKSHEKEVESDLRQVQATALRMKELIRRLLSFSRRSRAEYAPVELGQLVRELEAILAHSIPKNIDLKIEMGRENLSLYGNAAMLHQVLLNLCLNAVEAMPQGGTLRIGLRKAEAAPEIRSRYPHLSECPVAALEIEDTGKGIAREHLERIFEPFYTTKNLSSEKGTDWDWRLSGRMSGSTMVRWK